MATCVNLEQVMETPFKDNMYCFTQFNYQFSGDKVLVPTGTLSAAILPAGGVTAPTVSVATNDATGDLVTLTGGTLNVQLVLVSRHGGNPANPR
jgi:hypothetical protein